MGLRGGFRVSDDVLFQKDKPTDPEMRKQVGTNHPKDQKHTRMKFTDLRAAVVGKDRWVTGIKGSAMMKMDKPGTWSGSLIDGSGRHWEFECVRVAE